MKKLLLFFVMVAATLSSCDPPMNAWTWRIKNSTEQTLKFDHILLRYHRDSPNYGIYHATLIEPGDVITLYETSTRSDRQNKKYFADYFRKSAEAHEGDVYWRILSDDDVVLKTWRCSDESLPDQRFFEEDSWNYEQKPGEDALIEIEYVWTFDILPEDIQQTEQ